MKRLLPILLTVVVLLFNAGEGLSANFYKGEDAYESGDYATALREWEPLAKGGNVRAQYWMGRMYAKGNGVPKNYKTAVKWLRLAAEQGYRVAQHYLRNLQKKIAEQNPSTKVTAEKAPTPSSGDYQKGLVAYHRGDYVTALREFGSLVRQRNASAQFALGTMYRKGEGVPQNHTTAVKWYGLAAEQGHAGAQHNLGLMYDKGLGFRQDYETAVKWYGLAAEQGIDSAQRKSVLS